MAQLEVQLALIAGDKNLLRVAAAIYTLPKRQRSDIERISDLSGVRFGVVPIIDRLKALGMIADHPPDYLIKMLEDLALEALD